MTPGSALAIDHGTRRTGFAVADALRTSIEPLAAFRGPGDGPALLDHVQALLDERTVEALIVGWPLHMDGSEGGRTAEVEAFCARLRERFPGLAVVRVDERLTTKEAESRLAAAGFRGEERKLRRDSWSAALLLEDWIRAGEPR